MSAGVGASLLMIAAVIVREVVLRTARRNYLEAERRLDRNLRKLPRNHSRSGARKISIRDNELMLSHISRKSDAADTFGHLAEGHREVFSLCGDYLELTEKELRRTDVNSPRYVAMRKGRRKVRHLHKRHLLEWTEIESKALLGKAKDQATDSGKAETAAEALDIVEEAIEHYPDEITLIESADVIREFISAARLAGLMESAKGSEKDGDTSAALEAYESILARLSEEKITDEDRQLLVERVEEKLAKLRKG